MKEPFVSFTLPLELQSYISHCNTDFGCSIDWVVLEIQLTGWFGCFSKLGSLPCISGLQPRVVCSYYSGLITQR